MLTSKDDHKVLNGKKSETQNSTDRMIKIFLHTPCMFIHRRKAGSPALSGK